MHLVASTSPGHFSADDLLRLGLAHTRRERTGGANPHSEQRNVHAHLH